MSRKRKRERRRIAGLTYSQTLLLFLLVVVIALGAALTFGYTLGVFDSFFPPPIAMEAPTLTPEIQGDTLVPDSSEHAPQPDASTATDTTSVLASITPTAAETEATPTTATPTATIPATAPADVCAQLDLRFLNATSNIAVWRVGNTSGHSFTLNRIEIEWPKSNDAIFNAFLDGNVIWSGEDLVSPTFITSWIGEPADRSVNSPSRLEFFFGTAAAASGYDLSLWFENGCVVSRSN
jgi:hypothetical protein